MYSPAIQAENIYGPVPMNSVTRPSSTACSMHSAGIITADCGEEAIITGRKVSFPSPFISTDRGPVSVKYEPPVTERAEGVESSHLFIDAATSSASSASPLWKGTPSRIVNDSDLPSSEINQYDSSEHFSSLKKTLQEAESKKHEYEKKLAELEKERQIFELEQENWRLKRELENVKNGGTARLFER